MSKPFDMELFLAGVLTGSRATQHRHLRQARITQAEISEHWQRQRPLAEQACSVVSSPSTRRAQRINAVLLRTDGVAACSSLGEVMGIQQLNEGGRESLDCPA